MPTYADYLAHAAKKGFQPIGEQAFDALIRAGFDPIVGVWR
jgi:hypothetical protein